MRRLRRTAKIRTLLREVTVTTSDLIYPMFVAEGVVSPQPIPSMPGQFRLGHEGAVQKAENVVDAGIPAIILFGIPESKDSEGSSAWAEDGIVQRTVESLKQQLGEELVVITDVCLCQYTTHGHCGLVRNGEIDNDATLEALRKIAVSHAEAGVDIVAPSGMMDGQVAAIRQALDDAGYKNAAIMSYSSKHASCFYGPFRDATYATPMFGDRRSHQMDYANPSEAIREVELDLREGADIVIVKPALTNLDLIYRIKHKFNYPIAAYNVSGEYSLIKAASERGWVDEKKSVIEVLTSMKRAGADMIMTYFALEAAEWLREKL